MSGKPITRADPERVSLASVYFHFLVRAPSPRQAKIELSPVIREGKLDLRAAKVIELSPGEAPPKITFDVVIPADALADRLGLTFDWERSSAIWERPPPDSYFTFEDITAARDQVLALRPAPESAHIAEPGGDTPKYEWSALATELGRRIYVGQIIPSRDTEVREIARQLEDWCDKNWGQCPSNSLLREKIAVWLKAYKK